MKIFHPKKSRRRGLSLIETILAITIGAIAVVMVISFFQSGTASNKQNEAVQDLQHMSSKMQKLHAGLPGYGSTSNVNQYMERLAAAGVLSPGTWDDSTSTAYNPWRGTTTIEPNGTVFSITNTNIPQEACVGLITGNSGGFGSNLCGIQVGTNTVEGSADCSGARPNITAVDAAGLCQETNEIVWYMQ